MFKRILVPLDGSSRAEQALPVALRIAHATGGSIILLRVVTRPYLNYTGYTMYPSVLTTDVLDADITLATNYLKAVAGSHKLNGIQVTTQVTPGAAASTILDITQEKQADLVVMCSHGATGLKRWFLGSVAQQVARHCPVPVLVLREDGQQPTSSYPDRLHPLHTPRVLVALDGSKLAEDALLPAAHLVAALAAPARGSLFLTRTVTPLVTVRGWSDSWSKELAVDEAATYLNTVADRLLHGPMANLDLTVNWSVSVGSDVADTLIHIAENGADAEDSLTSSRCDLVAMATHGRTGMQRWAMGSVTERVLGATRLPLLVIRVTPGKSDSQKKEHTTTESDRTEVEKVSSP